MNNWSSFLGDLFSLYPSILAGLAHTIELTIAVTISGFIAGIVLFFLNLSQNLFIRIFAQGYISFFIGTPLIVLLFLMYYGLPQFGIRLSPFTVAFAGFTMNVAAYNAAYMTTAFNSLDYSEFEAARSQGFSESQVYLRIILPQVLYLSVPSLVNQAIANLKDSSIVFLIQFNEFFAEVQDLAAYDFQFLKVYTFAAIVYMGLVAILVKCGKALEKRINILFLGPAS